MIIFLLTNLLRGKRKFEVVSTFPFLEVDHFFLEIENF